MAGKSHGRWQAPLLSLAAWAARVLPEGVKRALYRSPRLAGLIRSELNRVAPQGLTTVEVAAGKLAGMRLSLNMQEEKDYWLGTYEPELQAALKELVLPGMTAYDVGANIGYITLLLAQLVGQQGCVFAFEALPDNLIRLNTNLALNGLSERVEVVSGAVVECTGRVRFMVGPTGGMGKAEGSAGRQNVAYPGTLEIDGFSLDEFVFRDGNPAPGVVKMDIEGGEVLALPGMSRLLQTARPIFFVELHGPEAAQAAWEALRSADYRVCRMASGLPAVADLTELDWKAYLVGLPT